MCLTYWLTPRAGPSFRGALSRISFWGPSRRLCLQDLTILVVSVWSEFIFFKFRFFSELVLLVLNCLKYNLWLNLLLYIDYIYFISGHSICCKWKIMLFHYILYNNCSFTNSVVKRQTCHCLDGQCHSFFHTHFAISDQEGGIISGHCVPALH